MPKDINLILPSKKGLGAVQISDIKTAHSPSLLKQNRLDPSSQEKLRHRVQILERELDYLTSINQLYLKQIEELEGDNLALCARLQSVKGHHGSVLTAQQEELTRTRLHCQQLTRIVHMLEEQLRVKDEERSQVVEVNQTLAGKVKRLDDMAIDTEILKTEVDRYKIKLLESEKYWLTRTETLVGSKQAEGEKKVLEVESRHGVQLRRWQEEVSLRDNIVREKTEQIHKLIEYIQNKLA